MQSRETSASEMCLGLREERLRGCFKARGFSKLVATAKETKEDKISSKRRFLQQFRVLIFVVFPCC